MYNLITLQGDALEIYASQTGGFGPDDTTGHIVIKVVDQNDTAIRFQLRPTTKFCKVMKAFSERIGLPQSDLRFFFDGQRINDDDTPLSLQMTQVKVGSFNLILLQSFYQSSVNLK